MCELLDKQSVRQTDRQAGRWQTRWHNVLLTGNYLGRQLQIQRRNFVLTLKILRMLSACTCYIIAEFYAYTHRLNHGAVVTVPLFIDRLAAWRRCVGLTQYGFRATGYFSFENATLPRRIKNSRKFQFGNILDSSRYNTISTQTSNIIGKQLQEFNVHATL